MKLDVLFIKDGTAWTAQCLQYDVAAQGDTLKDAQKAFEDVLAVEVAYLAKRGDSLDCLPAAPQCYWKLFREAALQVEQSREPTTRFPSEIAGLLSRILPIQRELRVA
jgi:hypothetical protein